MDTWPMVEAERLAQADEAATYRDDEWDAPTPCPGWRVREVLAHLVMRLSFAQLLPAMIRARLDADRLVADVAVQLAARHDSEELVALLRARAASRWCPPGVPPEGRLADLVVHAWDVRTALQRSVRERPDDRYVRALDFAVGAKGIFRGARRAHGLQLVVPDIGWEHGRGPRVEGSAEALLAALVGRLGALDGLAGNGVARLRARCEP